MPGKLRKQIASNQNLQKAKTIIRFEVTGLRLNLKKKIRRLFLRAENFAALRGINIRQKTPISFRPASDELAAGLFSSSGIADGTRVESSVIIPVFNKADLTIQCLHALARNVDTSRVEIIVVDNASTDQTQD